MKTSSKKSKKNLLALCLSFLMVASGASAFAACDNGSDDTSSDSTTSSSTSVNSDLKIANGDFETFNTNDGLSVIGTSTSTAPSWSRTSTASSLPSLAASGIVNVSEWDKLFKSKYDGDISKLTVEQAKALFEEDGALSVKDKLAYYDAWKAANSSDKDKIETKLKDFYQSFNVDSGDMPMDLEGNPLANPLTHDYSKSEDGTEDFGKGNNVLMIHNQRPEVKPNEKAEKGTGTAQKYTSSTKITVAAGTAATLSVWVKTMDLHIADTEGYLQPAVDAGAFISVTHSVGSKSLPALTVKNIDTERMGDLSATNGWKQYTFHLKGSAYADTSFTIELGLGMGNTDQFEYVNGYAFFDDVQCQTISYEKYDALVSATTPDKTVGYAATADEKTFASNGDATLDCFAIDLFHALDGSALLDSILATDTKPTTSKLNDGSEVSTVKGGIDKDGDGTVDVSVYEALGEGFDTANDVHEVFANAAAIAASNNTYLQAIYKNYFTYLDKEDDTRKAYDFTGANDSILMLLSADGAAYTLDTTYEFNFKDANDNYLEDYLAVSFFVKTSDMTGFTGASVTLNDGYNKYTFSGIDTTSAVPVKVDLNADGEEDSDVYDGWQQYFFFVENKYENKMDGKFTLSFNFGPTEIDGTTTTSYHEGFAAFTKFQVYPMSKAEYDAVSEGTYAKVVSVAGNTTEEATGNDGFDSAAIAPSNALDKGFAKPTNYHGVFSNSQYVNANGTHSERDNYANAGLLNKDGFAKYFAPTNSISKFLMDVTGESTADAVWNAMFGYNFGNNAAVGSRTQPLFIWNTEATITNEDGTVTKTNAVNSETGLLEYGYGFYGQNITLSENSYKKISLAVKVGALNDADKDKVFANIYLIDTDSKNNASALSIGRNLTYWYDDNGNICADEDCETIAFKLESNGLYTINKSWNEYKKLSDADKAKYEGYFANLNAYGEDKDGNKVVAEGGASHDYDDHWNNEGLDGIAFYAKKEIVDGNEVITYYADRACTIAVNNLFDVTKTDENSTAILEARYLAEANKELVYTVGYTNEQWVNVSFYIHTGEEAKTYRLEVWSGERNGAGNPVDSYVAFDMNDDSDAESYFTSYITQYTEDKTAYETEKNAVAFENVFSWYDSDSYLRYNKSLDKKGYGNLYADSFVYSSKESGVAYLCYQEGNEVRILADYKYEDVTVIPATPNDGSDNVSSPEDSTTTGDETNFFMLFSSIAIAAVLVFVIIAVIVRKLLKKFGKLPKNLFARKAKKEKKAKEVTTEEKPEVKPAAPKAKEELDEDSPYND